MNEKNTKILSFFCLLSYLYNNTSGYCGKAWKKVCCKKTTFFTLAKIEQDISKRTTILFSYFTPIVILAICIYSRKPKLCIRYIRVLRSIMGTDLK